jgi:hypothetical protein
MARKLQITPNLFEDSREAERALPQRARLLQLPFHEVDLLFASAHLVAFWIF